MTPSEIFNLRKSFKYSRRKFGLLISKILGFDRGVAIHTIYRWEKGLTKPHDVFERALQEINKLRDIKNDNQ